MRSSTYSTGWVGSPRSTKGEPPSVSAFKPMTSLLLPPLFLQGLWCMQAHGSVSAWPSTKASCTKMEKQACTACVSQKTCCKIEGESLSGSSVFLDLNAVYTKLIGLPVLNRKIDSGVFSIQCPSGKVAAVAPLWNDNSEHLQQHLMVLSL